MRGKLTSAVSPLQPSRVWDVKMGEEVLSWREPVNSLLAYVTEETVRLFMTRNERVLEVCGQDFRAKPTEWARQNGLKLSELPPKEVRAKSRVEKLVQHKLVSEVSAYAKNPNPRKQSPTFFPKVNLGAIDKQMATLSSEGKTLYLSWKVWDRELLFEFDVPVYVFKRDILKWSLPTVQLSKKTGEIVFGFTYVENPKKREPGKQKAGLDLGRIEPFTLAVLTEDGRRIADYTSSGRLKQASLKRDRLLLERKQVLTKLDAYKTLKHNLPKQEVLTGNAAALRSKIARIGTHVAHQVGHEVAAILARHETNVLKVENLSWAHGAKYGSRWNHSVQQEAITHALAREGVITIKVSPKNTSQECHKCSAKIIHTVKTRTVHCSGCKETFDRDFNAAMNIALKPRTYPTRKRRTGDDCNPTGQVAEAAKLHGSTSGSNLITRNTT